MIVVVERYVHSGNGKVERIIGVLKTLARVMPGDSNLHASYWFYAIQHASVLANMIFLVKLLKDPEREILAWEAQYDEKPHAYLILGHFVCLAHLVLQKEHRLARLDPKDDTDGGIGFGVRSIVGAFLGVHVDPVKMLYTCFRHDGKNVYTSKNNIITTGDIFPHNITVPRAIDFVPRARLGEGEAKRQAYFSWEEDCEEL